MFSRIGMKCLLMIGLLLCGCSGSPIVLGPPVKSLITETLIKTVEPPNTPTISPKITEATPIRSPSASLTSTVEPHFLEAVVYPSDPIVPVLTYHQFTADTAKYSTATKTRFSDFRAELQDLYDSGYSLVSFEEWLSGNISVPSGRRPLILTMDDLFFNNQIRLDEKGVPMVDTGIGILWQFYQQHLEFGFHMALFATLGDKLYANPDDPDWQEELGKTIAWCIDHDAMVYNHTYLHVYLDKTAPNDITWELHMNDQYLRQLLGMVQREDLISHLSNIVAIPYGAWPTKELALKALLGYTTPENKPMQAIFDIDFIVRPKFLMPPYSSKFDRLRLPRIVATLSAIDYLVEHRAEFPSAQSCFLGPLSSAMDPTESQIAQFIQSGIREKQCPEGIFAFPGKIYKAQESGVDLLFP